ncbi:chromogranin-A [Petaurus breviceps papuanus]|uniref:chromogranin-A n=1 Tax=Petaurus breviceps papuanus TaxID=3040969 RepID=UPI0036D80133
MSFPAFLVLLVSAMQVTALPVNSPANKSDTKVMRCIVEVISDTLSKPSPLPISEDCFETLRGDERIISILRHQNLLKELQELAIQGANERAQQQKKDRGFEDELSEVLGNQNNEDTIVKGELKDTSPEKPDEDATESKERSLKEREAQSKETNPKEVTEDSERNEISKASKDVSLESTLDSGLTKEESLAPKSSEDSKDQPTDSQESLDLKEEEQSSKTEKESNAEEEEEEEAHLAQAGNKETLDEEGPTGAFSTSSTLEENEETSRGDSQPEALDLNGARKVMEEEARSQEEKGLSRRSEEEAAATEDIFSPRESKSQELEEELSKEWEDSKRWNKMDELARELTAKKRLEESNSEEEPDRSMKLSFRSHKYDFGSPMGLPRRTWKAHSREDSIEAGLPLSIRGDPDEKKEEEGSANRRTEDQELESLAAIEAELENVAHKLHELRRG